VTRPRALIRFALAAGLALSCGFCNAQVTAQSRPAEVGAAQTTASQAKAALGSLPADLPLRRDVDSGAMPTAGYAIWFLFALGAIAVVASVTLRRGRKPAWIARFGRRNAPAGIEVLASTTLGAGSSLQLVRWGERELLLGCTAQSIRLLDSRIRSDGAVLPASAHQTSPSVRGNA
jgi:flagellar protein FliO/FliZ